MSYYKAYVDDILHRTNKNIKDYIISLGLATLIIFIVLLVGLRWVTSSYIPLKAILIALSELIPAVGSGVVFIPLILNKVFRGSYLLAGQISILYVTLVVIKQLIEPFIVGKYLGIRPIISGAVLIIFYLIGGLKGSILAALIVFIIKLILDMLDINVAYKKRQNIERVKKREIDKNSI